MERNTIDLAVLIGFFLFVASSWRWDVQHGIGFVFAGIFFVLWIHARRGTILSFAPLHKNVELKELHIYLGPEHIPTIFLGLSLLGLAVTANLLYLYLAWFAWILFRIRDIQKKEHIYVEDAHGGHH